MEYFETINGDFLQSIANIFSCISVVFREQLQRNAHTHTREKENRIFQIYCANQYREVTIFKKNEII